MEPMEHFIGGLFRNRKDAEEARKALQETGMEVSSMHMLECMHEKEIVVLEQNPSIKSIGKGALTGALILGGIGTVVGLLVGVGVIHIPSLGPEGEQALQFEITWQYILTSVMTGLIFGVWTGAIVGVAIRLAMAPYRKMDAPQPANKGDLMLAVQTNDKDRESQARSIMQEHGVLRFEEFEEYWDPEIWSVSNEEIQQVR